MKRIFRKGIVFFAATVVAAILTWSVPATAAKNCTASIQQPCNAIETAARRRCDICGGLALAPVLTTAAAQFIDVSSTVPRQTILARTVLAAVLSDNK